MGFLGTTHLKIAENFQVLGKSSYLKVGEGKHKYDLYQISSAYVRVIQIICALCFCAFVRVCVGGRVTQPNL